MRKLLFLFVCAAFPYSFVEHFKDADRIAVIGVKKTQEGVHVYFRLEDLVLRHIVVVGLDQVSEERGRDLFVRSETQRDEVFHQVGNLQLAEPRLVPLLKQRLRKLSQLLVNVVSGLLFLNTF